MGGLNKFQESRYINPAYWRTRKPGAAIGTHPYSSFREVIWDIHFESGLYQPTPYPRHLKTGIRVVCFLCSSLFETFVNIFALFAGFSVYHDSGIALLYGIVLIIARQLAICP